MCVYARIWKCCRQYEKCCVCVCEERARGLASYLARTPSIDPPLLLLLLFLFLDSVRKTGLLNLISTALEINPKHLLRSADTICEHYHLLSLRRAQCGENLKCLNVLLSFWFVNLKHTYAYMHKCIYMLSVWALFNTSNSCSANVRQCFAYLSTLVNT